MSVTSAMRETRIIRCLDGITVGRVSGDGCIFTHDYRDTYSKQAWLDILALPLHRDVFLEADALVGRVGRKFGLDGRL